MLNIGEKKTYDVGAQKNRLIETVLLSTQNTCLILMRINICCGYTKEPSHFDGSFEHPKHMLNIGEKNHTNFTLMKL